MTPEQFAYWLQGFVELTRGTAPDEAQWNSIQEHLDTVFKKVTPAVSKHPEAEKQTSSEFQKAIDEMYRRQRDRDAQQPRSWEPWYVPTIAPQQPYWPTPGGNPPGPIIC